MHMTNANTPIDTRADLTRSKKDDLLHAAADIIARNAFKAATMSAVTTRTYVYALRYWLVWYVLRYSKTVASSEPAHVARQFVLDHIVHNDDNGHTLYELPPDVEGRLIALGLKRGWGPASYATVEQRMAAYSKWSRLSGCEPFDDPFVTSLMAEARRQSNERSREHASSGSLPPAALNAMLATCTDGLRGIRDRAMLLMAWRMGDYTSSGIVRLRYESLQMLPAAWPVAYRLNAEHVAGDSEAEAVILTGEVAGSLYEWLEASGVRQGEVFRRLNRQGRVGSSISRDQVARAVHQRARLAGVPTKWATQSLRSGCGSGSDEPATGGRHDTEGV